jgi:pimeloyl-ACP methyl ester carboxylesterase
VAERVIRVGSGPPLVWLHAAGGVGEDDAVVGALAARGFEVIAPVGPGFDDLADLDDIADVHDLALWYDDLLGSLGLDGVPVVGHSFGGMVAAELAAHVPSRVGKLVLAAPLGMWRDDEQPADMFVAFPLTIQELLWADPATAPIPAPPSRNDVASSVADVDDPLLAMYLQLVQGMTAVTKFVWPLPDKGLHKRLHRISAPTLVIWGTKDRMVPPSYADDFAAAIPDARVELLDDAGHMVVLEKLDDFADRVAGFVNG